jgi:hypothetical protein
MLVLLECCYKEKGSLNSTHLLKYSHGVDPIANMHYHTIRHPNKWRWTRSDRLSYRFEELQIVFWISFFQFLTNIKKNFFYIHFCSFFPSFFQIHVFFIYLWFFTLCQTNLTSNCDRMFIFITFWTFFFFTYTKHKTVDKSIRTLPVFPIYFILIYNLKKIYTEVNSCPILIIC